MIPPRIPFVVTSEHPDSPSRVYAVKLTEDIVKLLATNVDMRIELDRSNPAENKLFVAGVGYQLSVSRETQVVDVARTSLSKRKVVIFGGLVEKISIKQELVAQKAIAIRQQSEQAEKDRLSRKTLTIDPQPKSGRTNARPDSRSRLLHKVSKPPGGPPRKRPDPEGTKSDGVEKVSSQSWSPPILAAAIPSVVASPPAILPKGTRPKPTETADLYARLCSEYRRKYAEYDAIEQWVDRRLSIFVQLQKDLCTAEANRSAKARISHRVVSEGNALKLDKEYKWKRAELEALRAELCAMRDRIVRLVESS